MRNALRLYFRYAAISIQGQMQYRASFVMLTAGYFLLTGLDFAALWVLFSHLGQHPGLDAARGGTAVWHGQHRLRRCRGRRTGV